MNPVEPLMAKALGDRAGATRRQIQFWTVNGALKCLPGTERQGTGNKRLYDPTEEAYAKLAVELGRHQISIGPLVGIIEACRDFLQNPKNFLEPSEWLVIYRGKNPEHYAVEMSSSDDLGKKVAIVNSAIVVKFNELIGLGPIDSFEERFRKVSRGIKKVSVPKKPTGKHRSRKPK